MVQHLAAVKKQQIGICKNTSQDTELKMQSRISESTAATTSTKKRACCAGLVTKCEGPSERRRGRGAFEALSALGVYLKRDAWNAEGEDFDGLGLGKWDYANVVTLTMYTKRVGAAL